MKEEEKEKTRTTKRSGRGVGGQAGGSKTGRGRGKEKWLKHVMVAVEEAVKHCPTLVAGDDQNRRNNKKSIN
uniref:Uncharacterized protein n=1 Tax=Caenorhabditis japonica TaxID=281687 RepID=A0A8R1EIN5_CAEJA